jgi:cell division protein FtsB
MLRMDGNATQVGLIARWSGVVLALLGLAFGYGLLHGRVNSLEHQVAKQDVSELVVPLTELSTRLASLEKEVERMRSAIEMRPTALSGAGNVTSGRR